jgi:hypothetical protein
MADCEVLDAIRFIDWNGAPEEAREFAATRAATREFPPGRQVGEMLYCRVMRAYIDRTLHLSAMLTKPILMAMLGVIMNGAQRLYVYYLTPAEQEEARTLQALYDPSTRKTLAHLPEDPKTGLVTVPTEVLAREIFAWTVDVPHAST